MESQPITLIRLSSLEQRNYMKPDAGNTTTFRANKSKPLYGFVYSGE
jgi:hypothetical protein